MLIIDVSPSRPAALAGRKPSRDSEAPLPGPRVTELYGCGTGYSRYTYVFSTLRLGV
jgi:hypothetical protein